MLSALDFESAPPPAARNPGRADVACFVGTVARRRGRPLPASTLAGLEAGGWVRGPWALSEERLQALHQVPVAVDSWDAFEALFDWAARPVAEGVAARGATWLGAAVRSFFARGGRTAVIVRVGDPWAFTGGTSRAEARSERMGAVIPGWSGSSSGAGSGGAAMRPFDPTDPRRWIGVEHLFGLPEVSHVCLPDLADILSTEAPPLPLDDPPPPPPEVFVPCGVDAPPAPDDRGLRSLRAPRLDGAGFGAWGRAVGAVSGFLRARRRDALLLASVPLPLEPLTGTGEGEADPGARDWLGFLERHGALTEGDPGSASAFVQMVWPWIATSSSADLPEGLEPPEGLLAGLLARNALERGTYRSVAGTPLPSVVRESPALDRGLGPDSPTARLARRICLVGREPEGMTLLSDVTTSPDEAWRPGGVSRLMSALLRAARRVGEAETFDLNGPPLWARIRRSMETLLEQHYRAGALRGASPAEAFTVRCGPETTTRNDLDSGRVRVEVSVLPAVSVERIVVSLELAPGGADLRRVEVA